MAIVFPEFQPFAHFYTLDYEPVCVCVCVRTRVRVSEWVCVCVLWL